MSFTIVCENCGAPSAPAVGICPYCKAILSASGETDVDSQTYSVLQAKYESGDLDGALQLAMRLLADSSLKDDTSFLLLCAKIMIEAEAPISRLDSTLSQAFLLNPLDPLVNEYMAIATAKRKMELREYDSAERKLLAVLRSSPKNAHASFLLGSLYFWGKKSPELAIRAMESCIRERPKFIRAWGCLGALYSSLGHKEHAARAFRQCIELEKDSSMREFFEEQLNNVS